MTGWLHRIGSAAMLAFGASAAQADVKQPPVPWKVTGELGKSSSARTALSGAACAPEGGRPKHCIVVNDEKKYAQFFTLGEREVIAGEAIRLLPDEVDGDAMDELDLEGAAYVPPSAADGQAYFYLTGSHGLSRKGELQASRFHLFRLPIDASTGQPAFAFGDDDAAPEIERTAALRETIKALPTVGEHAEGELDRNGVSIEGIAQLGGDLLFGFRSPCIAEKAFAMRVPLDSLFEDAAPPARKPSELRLGDNVGIRDLAAVDGGVLVLAGRSDDDRGDQKFTCGEDRIPPLPAPAVWFWTGVDGAEPALLGALPGIETTDKPEALIVLEETASAYRVLVLFDGKEDGAPLEFQIDK